MGDIAPKKKGGFFFKKPAWLENQVKNEVKTDSSSKEGTDLFSRSTDADKDSLAEQEKRKQARAEKRAKAAEEKASEKASKRRRISTEDEDPDVAESSRKKSTSPPVRSSPRSLSKRYDALVAAAAGKSRRKPVVIDLDNSSDADDRASKSVSPIRVKAITKPRAAPEIEEEEEFPELATKARENARQRLLATQQSASAGATASPSGDFLPAPEDPGPNIQVFIQPRIPDTEPLRVMRKYRQNLKMIRIAWCKKQGFSDEVTDTVFFTYRGHKVYDVATCKTLGIDLDASGRPVFPRSRKGSSEAGDQLVLVATNQALFEEDKSSAEIARKKAADEADGIVEVPEEAKEAQIKIMLKAKGIEQKLIVRPTTDFAKIAGAFRQMQNIPADKEISLQFDGEVLEPESTMADTEIEDMDSIEVHVK